MKTNMIFLRACLVILPFGLMLAGCSGGGGQPVEPILTHEEVKCLKDKAGYRSKTSCEQTTGCGWYNFRTDPVNGRCVKTPIKATGCPELSTEICGLEGLLTGKVCEIINNKCVDYVKPQETPEEACFNIGSSDENACASNANCRFLRYRINQDNGFCVPQVIAENECSDINTSEKTKKFVANICGLTGYLPENKECKLKGATCVAYVKAEETPQEKCFGHGASRTKCEAAGAACRFLTYHYNNNNMQGYCVAPLADIQETTCGQVAANYPNIVNNICGLKNYFVDQDKKCSPQSPNGCVDYVAPVRLSAQDVFNLSNGFGYATDNAAVFRLSEAFNKLKEVLDDVTSLVGIQANNEYLIDRLAKVPVGVAAFGLMEGLRDALTSAVFTAQMSKGTPKPLLLLTDSQHATNGRYGEAVQMFYDADKTQLAGLDAAKFDKFLAAIGRLGEPEAKLAALYAELAGKPTFQEQWVKYVYNRPLSNAFKTAYAAVDNAARLNLANMLIKSAVEADFALGSAKTNVANLISASGSWFSESKDLLGSAFTFIQGRAPDSLPVALAQYVVSKDNNNKITSPSAGLTYLTVSIGTALKNVFTGASVNWTNFATAALKTELAKSVSPVDKKLQEEIIAQILGEDVKYSVDTVFALSNGFNKDTRDDTSVAALLKAYKTLTPAEKQQLADKSANNQFFINRLAVISIGPKGYELITQLNTDLAGNFAVQMSKGTANTTPLMLITDPNHPMPSNKTDEENQIKVIKLFYTNDKTKLASLPVANFKQFVDVMGTARAPATTEVEWKDFYASMAKPAQLFTWVKKVYDVPLKNVFTSVVTANVTDTNQLVSNLLKSVVDEDLALPSGTVKTKVTDLMRANWIDPAVLSGTSFNLLTPDGNYKSLPVALADYLLSKHPVRPFIGSLNKADITYLTEVTVGVKNNLPNPGNAPSPPLWTTLLALPNLKTDLKAKVPGTDAEKGKTVARILGEVVTLTLDELWALVVQLKADTQDDDVKYILKEYVKLSKSDRVTLANRSASNQFLINFLALTPIGSPGISLIRALKLALAADWTAQMKKGTPNTPLISITGRNHPVPMARTYQAEAVEEFYLGDTTQLDKLPAENFERFLTYMEDLSLTNNQTKMLDYYTNLNKRTQLDVWVKYVYNKNMLNMFTAAINQHVIGQPAKNTLHSSLLKIAVDADQAVATGLPKNNVRTVINGWINNNAIASALNFNIIEQGANPTSLPVAVANYLSSKHGNTALTQLEVDYLRDVTGVIKGNLNAAGASGWITFADAALRTGLKAKVPGSNSAAKDAQVAIILGDNVVEDVWEKLMASNLMTLNLASRNTNYKNFGDALDQIVNFSDSTLKKKYIQTLVGKQAPLSAPIYKGLYLSNILMLAPITNDSEGWIKKIIEALPDNATVDEPITKKLWLQQKGATGSLSHNVAAITNYLVGTYGIAVPATIINDSRHADIKTAFSKVSTSLAKAKFTAAELGDSVDKLGKIITELNFNVLADSQLGREIIENVASLQSGDSDSQAFKVNILTRLISYRNLIASGGNGLGILHAMAMGPIDQNFKDAFGPITAQLTNQQLKSWYEQKAEGNLRWTDNLTIVGMFLANRSHNGIANDNKDIILELLPQLADRNPQFNQADLDIVWNAANGGLDNKNFRNSMQREPATFILKKIAYLYSKAKPANKALGQEFIWNLVGGNGVIFKRFGTLNTEGIVQNMLRGVIDKDTVEIFNAFIDAQNNANDKQELLTRDGTGTTRPPLKYLIDSNLAGGSTPGGRLGLPEATESSKYRTELIRLYIQNDGLDWLQNRDTIARLYPLFNSLLPNSPGAAKSYEDFLTLFDKLDQAMFAAWVVFFSNTQAEIDQRAPVVKKIMEAAINESDKKLRGLIFSVALQNDLSHNIFSAVAMIPAVAQEPKRFGKNRTNLINTYNLPKFQLFMNNLDKFGLRPKPTLKDSGFLINNTWQYGSLLWLIMKSEQFIIANKATLFTFFIADPTAMTYRSFLRTIGDEFARHGIDRTPSLTTVATYGSDAITVINATMNSPPISSFAGDVNTVKDWIGIVP